MSLIGVSSNSISTHNTHTSTQRSRNHGPSRLLVAGRHARSFAWISAARSCFPAAHDVAFSWNTYRHQQANFELFWHRRGSCGYGSRGFQRRRRLRLAKQCERRAVVIDARPHSRVYRVYKALRSAAKSPRSLTP